MTGVVSEPSWPVVACGCMWMAVDGCGQLCGCLWTTLWLSVGGQLAGVSSVALWLPQGACGCLWLLVVACGCLWKGTTS